MVEIVNSKIEDLKENLAVVELLWKWKKEEIGSIVHVVHSQLWPNKLEEGRVTSVDNNLLVPSLDLLNCSPFYLQLCSSLAQRSAILGGSSLHWRLKVGFEMSLPT